MAIDPIYQRITFVDANGKLTREAIRLLEQITTTGNTVQNISNTTVMQGQASAFDDVPQRDISHEIVNALLQTGDTPRPQYVDTSVDWSAVPQPYVERLVDWSTPVMPVGDAMVDWSAPVQVVIDPLASALLNDAPQAVQIDPLSTMLLFDSCSTPTPWQSWTPVITPGGSMTITGASVTSAQYRVIDNNVVLFSFWVGGTLGGTASNFVNISLPIVNFGPATICTGKYQGSGNWIDALTYIPAGSGVLQVNAQTTLSLVSTSFLVSGFYRIS